MRVATGSGCKSLSPKERGAIEFVDCGSSWVWGQLLGLTCPTLWRGGIDIVNRRAPLADLFSGFFFCDSVTFLDLSGKLILLPGDDVEIVVGELAPFLFDGTLHLLPLSFDLIPVHQ